MTDLLEQLFQIYREAFPAYERRTEPDLRAAFNTSAYRILTTAYQGELTGFAVLFVPSNYPFALLEYLAVAPGQRSRGLGRELLNDAVAATAGRSLLAEVECALENPEAARRQAFYQRSGFGRINDLKYQLPLPGNPPPMELWICPGPSPLITRNVLASWLRVIYTDVYGCAPDDPRIANMMATLAA